MGFFQELKRRNVYKVAVAYAVVGWFLIQVATQTFPFFEIPNWAVRLVILAIIVGFPIALEALIKTHADRPVSIATVYAFRGEADQMFDWLNRSYEQREPTLVAALGVHPFFMRYYSAPRFVELCRKIGVTLSK